MSQAALLKAIRDQLQALFSLDNDSCEIGFTGEPKPSAGELYIAVWPGRWAQLMQGDIGFGESFGAKVTITRRLGYVPKDRWGPEIWLKEVEGIEAMARKIMLELAADNTGSLDTQSRYALLRKANEYIGIAQTDPPTWDNGFSVPFTRWDGGTPEVKGPQWFSSPPPEDLEGTEVIAGVAQTLTFDGAERYHVVSLAT